MPAFRHDGRLYYFAHVPKCAGTTIERHLEERFGSLELLGPTSVRGVSPQHWTWPEAEAAFAPEEIVYSFAVVRHPVSRFVSEFNMRMAQVNPPFPREIGLSDFARWVESRLGKFPSLLDNHLRPQTDFLGPDTRIFRLEDGLDSVLAWLDSHFPGADPAVGLAHERHRPDATADLFEEVEQGLDQHVIARLQRIYARDFARLGYEAHDRSEGARVLVLKAEHAKAGARAKWLFRTALASARHRLLRPKQHGVA